MKEKDIKVIYMSRQTYMFNTEIEFYQTQSTFEDVVSKLTAPYLADQNFLDLDQASNYVNSNRGRWVVYEVHVPAQALVTNKTGNICLNKDYNLEANNIKGLHLITIQDRTFAENKNFNEENIAPFVGKNLPHVHGQKTFPQNTLSLFKPIKQNSEDSLQTGFECHIL